MEALKGTDDDQFLGAAHVAEAVRRAPQPLDGRAQPVAGPQARVVEEQHFQVPSLDAEPLPGRGGHVGGARELGHAADAAKPGP